MTEQAPRPGRARKILLGILVVPLAMLVVGSGVVYGVSEAKLARRWTIEPRPVTVPSDAAAVERGRYLVRHVMGCADCHGDDLAGKVVVDAFPVGTIPAPNLTAGRGGLTDPFEPTDWVRAIRHGAGRDGRPLVLMPSEDYQAFSDDDLGAVIAYVRSVPPVDRQVTPVSLGPVGRLLVAKGDLRLAVEFVDHTAAPPDAAPGATLEYGRVLGNVCTGCHGPTLSGGPIPGGPPDWPPARNITPDVQTGIGAWTEADFVTAMREGKRPDGAALAEVMPWRAYAAMRDEDLEALWLYLRAATARPFGGR